MTESLLWDCRFEKHFGVSNTRVTVPGGSAEAGGQIKVGDVLMQVDGTNVRLSAQVDGVSLRLLPYLSR